MGRLEVEAHAATVQLDAGVGERWGDAVQQAGAEVVDGVAGLEASVGMALEASVLGERQAVVFDGGGAAASAVWRRPEHNRSAAVHEGAGESGTVADREPGLLELSHRRSGWGTVGDEAREQQGQCGTEPEEGLGFGGDRCGGHAQGAGEESAGQQGVAQARGRHPVAPAQLGMRRKAWLTVMA